MYRRGRLAKVGVGPSELTAGEDSVLMAGRVRSVESVRRNSSAGSRMDINPEVSDA